MADGDSARSFTSIFEQVGLCPPLNRHASHLSLLKLDFPSVRPNVDSQTDPHHFRLPISIRGVGVCMYPSTLFWRYLTFVIRSIPLGGIFPPARIPDDQQE